MNRKINELMSDKGVCRTAPATEGLLNTLNMCEEILLKNINRKKKQKKKKINMLFLLIYKLQKQLKLQFSLQVL